MRTATGGYVDAKRRGVQAQWLCASTRRHKAHIATGELGPPPTPAIIAALMEAFQSCQTASSLDTPTRGIGSMRGAGPALSPAVLWRHPPAPGGQVTDVNQVPGHCSLQSTKSNGKRKGTEVTSALGSNPWSTQACAHPGSHKKLAEEFEVHSGTQSFGLCTLRACSRAARPFAPARPLVPPLCELAVLGMEATLADHPAFLDAQIAPVPIILMQ